KPDAAERHTGYQVGGTSPFGTRKHLPVYVERSILELPAIYINGGNRGFLLGISPRILTDLLHAQPLDRATLDLFSRRSWHDLAFSKFCCILKRIFYLIRVYDWYPLCPTATSRSQAKPATNLLKARVRMPQKPWCRWKE